MKGNEKIYGNDEPSVVQVVQTMETYKQSNVKVINIEDFEDYRVASLIIDDFFIASALFKKNSNGNYNLENFQVGNHWGNQSNVHIFKLNPIRMYHLVFTEEHEVAHLEIQVNKIKGEPVKLTPKKESFYYFKLDDIDPNEEELYEWKFIFFNKEEKLLKMEEGDYWIYMDGK